MAKPLRDLPRLDLRSLPGPETILRRELPNGIIFLARENFASPSVIVSGHLRVGSMDEPKEKAGLADLVASALMRGTERRSFNEIYESLEPIGANLSVGAGTHNTSFRGKSLAEDLGVLLDLLVDILCHPVFPEAQVERLRAEKLTGLAIRDQDTGALAQMAFDELVYPDHPYGIPSDGYRETLTALTPGDLRDFHRRHYGPAGMVVTVVGAVEREAGAEAVERAFGAWQVPDQAVQADLPPVAPLESEERRDALVPGKSQSDLILGVAGPSRYDPDYLPASIGNSVLGRFGLMGRLGDVVRESAGLAYHASSSLAGGPGPGAWQVNAGVAPANVARALDLIRSELRRFAERGITRQELLDNQATFIGRLPLQLESNEGVAGALINMERFQLGLDYYQRYPSLVASVTRPQVRAAASRFFSGAHLAIAVAGPATPEG
jgi:zinc protease